MQANNITLVELEARLTRVENQHKQLQEVMTSALKNCLAMSNAIIALNSRIDLLDDIVIGSGGEDDKGLYGL